MARGFDRTYQRTLKSGVTRKFGKLPLGANLGSYVKAPAKYGNVYLPAGKRATKRSTFVSGSELKRAQASQALGRQVSLKQAAAARLSGELPYRNAAAEAQAAETRGRKTALQQQAAYAVSVGLVATEKEFIAKHVEFLDAIHEVSGFRFTLHSDGSWSKRPEVRNWAHWHRIDEDRFDDAAEWYRANASFYGRDISQALFEMHPDHASPGTTQMRRAA